MVKNIAELICYAEYTGQDLTAYNNLRQAVDWLCKKPEVLEVLEKAYLLHGKPLTIRVDSDGEIKAAYHNDFHEVIIDPSAILH